MRDEERHAVPNRSGSRSRRSRAVGVVLLLVLAACVHDSAAPDPFSGPSELGLSLSLSASPDVLPLNGTAQAFIGIRARGPDGEALPNVALRLQLATARGFEDFGRLSTRRVVTGSTGRAVVVYTAPQLATGRAPATDTGEVVTIWVTPEGNDFGNAVSRGLTIRLVPPGGVIPPFGATVGFTVTPAAPTVFNDVLFTTACPEAASIDCVRDPDGIVTSYRWEFGDGRTGSGPIESNTYEAAGTYLVTLTIGDGHGRTATVTRAVVVGGGTPPTAMLTASPTTVMAGDAVFFNGSGSRAAPGRSLVSHHWDFGDGSSGSGVTASHAYSNEGTYVVTLNVFDDQGQVGTATTSVVVQAPAAAALGASPVDPAADEVVFLDASASYSGLPMMEYR